MCNLVSPGQGLRIGPHLVLHSFQLLFLLCVPRSVTSSQKMAEGAVTTGHAQTSVGNVSSPEATNGSVSSETLVLPQVEVPVLSSASGEEPHSVNASSSSPTWGLLPLLNDSSVFLPTPSAAEIQCYLSDVNRSADRAGLVETSVSASLLHVGGRLLSCFIDVEGVAFMFFKVVDIPRLAFGVRSLASVTVGAEEIKAVLSATPLVMGTWSSGVWRFSDAIDALQ
ncbi:hypothetical protein MRX96_045668 [Rhipicephalus microplus]